LLRFKVAWRAQSSRNLKETDMMQAQLVKGFPESRPQGFGAVRSPIQSLGVERGHRRMAEVAVSGAVNPQFNWGGLAQGVLSALPTIASLF
jgi:hypothetical protein